VGDNPVLWAALLIFSCVPMCLSSVYKQKALGEVDVDPIYLNGWIAVWQFLLSLPLLLPSAPLSNVAIRDIPQNLADGWKCFLGENTVSNPYPHRIAIACN
jgi:drug/metabolite transporter (DMT)-like permease